jgi:hypothetical protein
MSPQGYRPSYRYEHIMRTVLNPLHSQCELMAGNNCKYSWDQRFNVSSNDDMSVSVKRQRFLRRFPEMPSSPKIMRNHTHIHNTIDTYIALRPFPTGVDRDDFLPLAMLACSIWRNVRLGHPPRTLPSESAWKMNDCRLQIASALLLPYTYIPLTLYPRRGSRGISDIPLRHPRFTKIS